jgi:hypothetical protein
MRWPDPPAPAPMSRIAVVAPAAALRPVLVGVAGAGTVQVDASPSEAAPGEAARRLQRLGRASAGTPRVAAVRPDLDLLERSGRTDLLAGEAELEERAAGAVRRGAVTALAGWVPRAELPDLAARLAGAGGALVPLPSPPGVDPPTLVRHAGAARSFEPLVGTYATVPYRDVDPVATGAALPAGRACAAALEAAVRYALADAAARAVRTEAEQTRLRRRAVEDRWLPRLEDRQHALNAELDEQDRAEATSRRRGSSR